MTEANSKGKLTLIEFEFVGRHYRTDNFSYLLLTVEPEVSSVNYYEIQKEV